MRKKPTPTERVEKLFQAIGSYSVQVSETKELAPDSELAGRMKDVQQLATELEQAHNLLDDPEGSRIVRNSKDSYPEGQPKHELTLCERISALQCYAADYKKWYEQAQELLRAVNLSKHGHGIFLQPNVEDWFTARKELIGS